MAEKCLLLKLPNGLLTEADILTVVAMATVVVAGRVAVLESAVVVEVDMIETGSSQGHKWDFCNSVILEIPSPHLPLNPPLFHCPKLNIICTGIHFWLSILSMKISLRPAINTRKQLN